jgi:hypothetical protein
VFTNKILRVAVLAVVVLGALFGSNIGLGANEGEVQPADPCWVGPDDAGVIIGPGMCEGYGPGVPGPILPPPPPTPSM